MDYEKKYICIDIYVRHTHNVTRLSRLELNCVYFTIRLHAYSKKHYAHFNYRITIE